MANKFTNVTSVGSTIVTTTTSRNSLFVVESRHIGLAVAFQHYMRPSYQDEAVSNYLKQDDLSSKNLFMVEPILMFP